MIVEELFAVEKLEKSSKGKIRVIPKSDIKTLIGRSPDLLDTILMRAVFEVLNVVKRRGSSSAGRN